jgi:hypothetical protein
MTKYYHVIVDGKPLEFGGVPVVYSRGQAIKKARQFVGKIQALSPEASAKEEMKAALQKLETAFLNVLNVSDYEHQFNDKYPFQKNFAEIVDDVIEWISSETM